MIRQMCVLVWEKPGRLDDLTVVIDELLEIVAEHGGVCKRRWLRDDARADADPAEMMMLEWQRDAHFEAFRRDQRVVETVRRTPVIASWQTVWVHAR